MDDSKREFLRHTLATLAYRGGNTLREAPAGFAEFRAAEGVRTPVEVLSHIGDLMDWALWLARGDHKWNDKPPLPWNEGIQRCYSSTGALEAYLASEAPLACTAEKLFQGPITDALTHFGQIAMLRRMAGAPIRGENYFLAQINAGCVGPAQAAAVREFD